MRESNDRDLKATVPFWPTKTKPFAEKPALFEAVVEIISENLSAVQIAVLLSLQEEFSYPASQVASDIANDYPAYRLTDVQVRRIRAELYKLGFARRGYLIQEESGKLAGYGYFLSNSGSQASHILGHAALLPAAYVGWFAQLLMRPEA
jgi:hypothetical protein